MGLQRHLIAGTALAALVSFVPAVQAQDSGSMQVGGATVSVGVGTAILGLPDVEFGQIGAAGGVFLDQIKSNDDFIDEYGWNVNGSITAPMGANKTLSLNGFWANIDNDDTSTCIPAAGTFCTFVSIFDGPGAEAVSVGGPTALVSDRDVDHWGVSLESKWLLNPGVMGVTRAPHRRYLTLGADVRGIDQKLDLDVTVVASSATIATLDEDLDTRYYGGYLAWGGDYSLPFVGGMTSGLGLRSTFQLRGGVYYADTDYDGVSFLVGNAVTRNLSLSRSDTAFIGGLVLETSKQFGARTTLSLKSEYEYYSYVPDMRYNNIDVDTALTGPNIGTSIGDDSAFSAKTSLRLTIKLGPDSVFEEPLK